MLNAKKISGLIFLATGLTMTIFYFPSSSIIKNILFTEGLIVIICSSIFIFSVFKKPNSPDYNTVNKLAVVSILLGTMGVMAFWFPWMGLALSGVGLILSAVCFIMAFRFKHVSVLVILSLFISLTGSNISGFFTFKTLSYANALSIKYKEGSKINFENN